MIKKALDLSSNKANGKPPTASSTTANSRRAYARVTNKASAAAKQRIYRSPLSQGAFPQPSFPKRLSVPVSRATRQVVNGSDEMVGDEVMSSEGAYIASRNSATIPQYRMPSTKIE